MVLAILESEYDISKWRCLSIGAKYKETYKEDDRQKDLGGVGSNHLIHVRSSRLPLDEPVVKHLPSLSNIDAGYLAGITVE